MLENSSKELLIFLYTLVLIVSNLFLLNLSINKIKQLNVFVKYKLMSETYYIQSVHLYFSEFLKLEKEKSFYEKTKIKDLFLFRIINNYSKNFYLSLLNNQFDIFV